MNDYKELMNRETLFRGKRIDNGEWLYGDLMNYADTAQIWVQTDQGKWNITVDPTTVGQYTGLTDKNGKKIFQGDIMLVSTGIEDYKFEVRYGPCGGVKNVEHNVGYIGFYFGVITNSNWMKTTLRTDPIYFLEAGFYVEVIGNIHDNDLEDFYGKNAETN